MTRMKAPDFIKTLLALACALIGTAHAEAQLEGRTLRFQDDAGRITWTRSYPAAVGPLLGPVAQDNLSWLAVGPALYAYDDDGEQRVRLDFPGDISALDGEGGTLQVTSGFGSVRQTFTVNGAQIQGRVVLPPDPEVTGWLRRAAAAVPQAQLRAAASADPANPFLQLRLARLAQLQGDRYGAIAAAQQAVTAQVPFAASVQLAADLDDAGFPSAADLSLDKAAREWAARGYDPALPVSRDALRAYGNPLGELNILLAQNKLRRADAWIRYLREVSPRFQDYPEVYARYATILDAQDRSGEADEWRQFSRDLSAGTLYNLGPGALLILRDAFRVLAAALLMAVLAALLTFEAHYWTVQGRDLALLGGRWRSWLLHPLSRARRITLAYAGFGEKLVLVSLLLGLLFTLSGWVWTSRVDERLHDPALNAGTYGGAWFYDGLDRLELSGEARDIALIRGVAAQLDASASLARQTYSRVPPSACILNNLGVLAAGAEDTAQARDSYRQALALDPGQTSAAYNLGLNPQDPDSVFQARFRPKQPRLCYPDQQTLIQALDLAPGSSALGLLRDPWNSLNRLPTGLPRILQGLWVAALLVLGTACLLWLLVPRLPQAIHAGRSAAYRLLALLLPGAALLEGAWGSVLLLGWAMTISALLGLSGWWRLDALLGAAGPGLRTLLLGILAFIYVLNIVAFVLAEVRAARQGQRAARQPG
ncbi:hypothetical protein GCM10008957_16910 [Deinococcus ruber]|uniref:Tetratricopeptide repeat protein n=2 Tax=Deinococcus ruber TaxID=1848197 RepID=A0A918C4N9_9DEIO|nr:hypothetical protein GCM10008957_16910 [Deinococcus ruber]